MKKLMWGKFSAAIAKKTITGTGDSATVSYGDFKLFPEAVEGSLALNTTKGEKKEAKVEGGGVEAVKYGKNTYALEASFRRGLDSKGKTITFPTDNDELDGVVDGVYALRVQPEDKTAGGLTVMEVIISTEDTFTAADGAIKKFSFDFIKPEPESDGTQKPTIDWEPIPNITAAFSTGN